MVRKYTQFDSALTKETAYAQAAKLLDIAAAWAVENKDATMMANLAGGWMEMASRLGSLDEEDESGDETMDLDSEPRYPMGFSPNQSDEDEDDEDIEYEPEEI